MFLIVFPGVSPMALQRMIAQQSSTSHATSNASELYNATTLANNILDEDSKNYYQKDYSQWLHLRNL
jgi:hypothetical protein